LIKFLPAKKVIGAFGRTVNAGLQITKLRQISRLLRSTSRQGRASYLNLVGYFSDSDKRRLLSVH